MKKNIALLSTLGFLLVGCNVMEPPSEHNNKIQGSSGVNRTKKPNVESTCKASCVINDLQTWDLATGLDSTQFFGLVGDTLREYYYRLEDGREGILQRSEFLGLIVGDTLPNCSTENAVGSCPY